jgi:hypothetical protein
VGYYSSILESASSGAIVKQVTASDLDVGTYGTISYAFVENQAQFAIDSTSVSFLHLPVSLFSFVIVL